MVASPPRRQSYGGRGSVRVPTAAPLSTGNKQRRRKRPSSAGAAAVAASAAVVDGLIGKIQHHMDSEHWRQVDVFRMIDVDGSGTLSAVELHRALAQMQGDAPTRSEVDALLRAVDENGNGTVSVEEFFNYFKRARRKPHGSGPVQFTTATGKKKLFKSQRRGTKNTEEDLMEHKLQKANDENYLLQMQLTKLQSTLKTTQSKLISVQAWRDASDGSPKSPYEPLFEKQVASLAAQLKATEEKLKIAQQSQLKLRTVQTWQANSSQSEAELGTDQNNDDFNREAESVENEYDSKLEQVRAAAKERETEAGALMKEQNAEIDRLREQLETTQQALSKLETNCSKLLGERNELELLYNRDGGAAQNRIAELEATVTELERDQSEARQQIANLEQASADWQTQRAKMEESLREAAETLEILGQQEVQLKEYTAVKRERDDIHAKLAIALSVSKDAEARAAKASKQLDSLKKKRGKLANGAAKQWAKERSELESAMMAERAKIDELNARIDLYETNKQVMEATQLKLKAKLDACISADGAQQELAEAHTATLEQNRKLVADLVAAQGFEDQLHSCRAELASVRASLKKEIGKKETLDSKVRELEEARNVSRKGEGEKGVMFAQLREQVHSWKSKAEKRKDKLAGLAKELTIVQQALDKATAQGIKANESAEAHEEDGRMWRLVAEQAQEQESHLSAELEQATRQLEHSEVRVEELEHQLTEQKNAARQATAERNKMHRELTHVLETIARGETDVIRQQHLAGGFLGPTQPGWLGSQPADRGAAGSSASMAASSSDRSCSPSLLSDDGEGTDSVGSASKVSEAYETHGNSYVEQVLEKSRQRAARLRREQQQHHHQQHQHQQQQHQQQQHQHQHQQHQHQHQHQEEEEETDSNDGQASQSSDFDVDEVAFMAVAAAKEVHMKQAKAVRTKPTVARSVDARQVRTPVTNTVRSHEAAHASEARRRNKRVKRKQKMARLSVMESGA